MYLYHATYSNRSERIEKEGLKPNMPPNFEGMTMRNAVYLAFSPEAAISYAENSDYYENTNEDLKIIVYKVNINALNNEKIGYDWNNLCEYENDINSIAYFDTIPAENLTLIDDNEINNTPDYHLTDYKEYHLYWIISQIFDEEVETNKESL